ncbi:MAG: 1-acyl-sn-glycerol-3-phosphate acyltransferase [Lachnospiraceae bacterium]|nr:1-acyl-sn-glycerol-3-phosphate acyltransferase [Lachnospiraceae bacterium]
MKIKVTEKSFKDVLKLEGAKHIKPLKQSRFLRWLIKVLSAKELKETGFSYISEGMNKLGKKEPCLILMNHSSFTDLQIIGTVFSDRSYHIVCTNDGFVGKGLLMRRVGCIPTKKFIPEAVLIKDMKYALTKLKSSVVMYPEASYSFDGSETPLPESLGKCLKLLGVPVVMVKTQGAFLRDPLYNGLKKRKTKVSAIVRYLLTPEEIKEKSPEELNAKLTEAFKYDHFRAQHEAGVLIKEPFRAEGLHRVLYKCPDCMAEGCMEGKGIYIRCCNCGSLYELKEDGTLEGQKEKTKFSYITDWYKWERECVKEELLNAKYRLSTDVDIMVLVDEKSMYHVGEGHLTHDLTGFTLTGCNGELSYHQSGSASYSLYADYFWYEIGDVISIGDNKMQYYCFPKEKEGSNVAKARLAAEELFRLKNSEKGIKSFTS